MPQLRQHQSTAHHGSHCHRASRQAAHPPHWRWLRYVASTTPQGGRGAVIRSAVSHTCAQNTSGPTHVMNGIEHGFRVGFTHGSQLTPACHNMCSALLHPSVVDAYISTETREGRMLGPFPPGRIEGLQINRMGVVQKGHTPGKWRLITDLSYPEGNSINDGIRSELCSLKYTSVERVARAAQQLGRGALLAKLDIKSAYRLVPVHPGDRNLPAIEWHGACYVDRALPFGPRSAPNIFTAVADALQWVMLQRGVSVVDHYMDYFVTMSPPHTDTCRVNLDRILAVCRDLGVPFAIEKQGPSQCMTFLGIEIEIPSAASYASRQRN